jgi:hypothetical protein
MPKVDILQKSQVIKDWNLEWKFANLFILEVILFKPYIITVYSLIIPLNEAVLKIYHSP